MAYTSIPLIVPMAMMGIAFSLIPAVMWPSVAYIVEEKKIGEVVGLRARLRAAEKRGGTRITTGSGVPQFPRLAGAEHRLRGPVTTWELGESRPPACCYHPRPNVGFDHTQIASGSRDISHPRKEARVQYPRPDTHWRHVECSVEPQQHVL
jgi:hypothetical protein